MPLFVGCLGSTTPRRVIVAGGGESGQELIGLIGLIGLILLVEDCGGRGGLLWGDVSVNVYRGLD